jgi:hypothetical protein
MITGATFLRVTWRMLNGKNETSRAIEGYGPVSSDASAFRTTAADAWLILRMMRGLVGPPRGEMTLTRLACTYSIVILRQITLANVGR